MNSFLFYEELCFKIFLMVFFERNIVKIFCSFCVVGFIETESFKDY